MSRTRLLDVPWLGEASETHSGGRQSERGVCHPSFHCPGLLSNTGSGLENHRVFRRVARFWCNPYHQHHLQDGTRRPDRALCPEGTMARPSGPTPQSQLLSQLPNQLRSQLLGQLPDQLQIQPTPRLNYLLIQLPIELPSQLPNQLRNQLPNQASYRLPFPWLHLCPARRSS